MNHREQKAEQGDGIPGEITRLLLAWGHGKKEAFPMVYNKVYHDLRRIARHQFHELEKDLTLQPTALVNELFLQLAHEEKLWFPNRHKFFAFANTVMKHIFRDWLKARNALKRGGGKKDSLETEPPDPNQLDPIVKLAILSAMNQLNKNHTRQAQVVKLHFFEGKTYDEIAREIKVSRATICRDWDQAKQQMFLMLHKPDPLEDCVPPERGESKKESAEK